MWKSMILTWNWSYSNMWILVVALLVCLFIGMPIGISLGVSSLIYLGIINPEFLSIVPQKIYTGFNNYGLIALPLFIAMGQIMNEAGLTKKIIDFSAIFIRKQKGGLGSVNVIASMIFGGISGSSTSDTASVGAILIPEMEKRGYTKSYAAGITVASSTMGMIIPPSVPMVIYAISSNQSIGRLFIASLIPGIMIGLFQLMMNKYLAHKNNFPVEDVSFESKKEFFLLLKESILALLMPIIVIGSVVLAIATSNESASFGVMYALLVGFFIYKTIKFRIIPKLFIHAIKVSSSIMIIIASSQLYVWILSIEKIPEKLGGLIVALGFSPQFTLIIMMIIILLAGTFIDVTPAIIIFTPVFLPVCMQLGISPIQFGVLLIAGLAVGAVTPPVGTCLNVAASISDLSIFQIFRGALPILIGNLLVLILICIVPFFTLWLPNMLVR